MRTKNDGLGWCGGFTMIEIAISLGIIAFALVAIIGILPEGMKVQRVNREETIINQETSVLLEAICNGEQGLDDLTNYVVAITNSQTWYPVGGKPGATEVYGYTLTNSTVGSGLMSPQFPIFNGFRIVGLLSTPKYAPFYTTRGLQGFYSNHVVATVRSMSGTASDKAPQRNVAVQAMAFTYRVFPEVTAYGAGNPLAGYSNAWLPDWTNYTAYPSASDWQWRSNYFKYAENLQADLDEVRLLFRWPVLPNGALGRAGRQVVRAVTAGPVQSFADPAYSFPYTWLYFVQPKTFARAQ